MNTSSQFKYLVPEAGSAWREPIVAGTGIRASTLTFAVRNDGRTPEEVAADFDVPVDAVRESIAYVDLHADELEQERREFDQVLIRRGLMNSDGTWNSISMMT